MLLYITCGEINPSALDIFLKDGCEPTRCGYQHPNGNFESAIWFKVMIIDSITIDCNRQQLSWIPLSDPDSVDPDSVIAANTDDSSTEKQSQCAMLSCFDECIESNLDTLFRSFEELATQYQSGLKTREEWFEMIIQLLHIDVLPNIHLTSGYVKCIEFFLQSQDDYIKKIDGNLIKKTDERNLKKQALANMRSKFLSELIKPSWRPLPKLIVARLLLDFTKDIKSINDVMTNTANLQRQASELELAITRLKEMQHPTLLQRFKGVLISVPMEPIHNVYMALCEYVDLCSDSVKHLTDKKLLMLSVKEAARSALYDLKSGEQTFGLEVDSISSMRSTDVLGENRVTSLLSIAEQVSAVLAIKGNYLSQIHQDFIRNLIARCEATKREKALFDDVTRSYREADSGSCTDFDECNSNLEIKLGSADSSINSPDTERSYRSSNCSSGVSCNRNCDDDSVCDTRSLPMPVLKPLTLDGIDCARSVSAYLSASGEHCKNVNTKTRNSLLLKRQKVNEPTFKSYLPDLVSLSEENASIDSPIIVFDINKIMNAAETVKTEVVGHMKRMCIEFQKHLRFNYPDPSVYRQIWVSYESHLYNELMLPLTELYQLQYTNITEALCESLESLSSTDLDLDDAFLVHLLQDNSSSASSSPAISLGSSLVSNQEPAPCKLLDSADIREGEGLSSTRNVERHMSDTSEEVKQSDVSEDDLNTLRRCFSETRQQRRILRTVRKSVQVKAFERPTVIIYERKVNPVVSELSNVSSVADGIKNCSQNCRTMKMKHRYIAMFDSALKCIDAAISARTPANKLRHLTQALRETARLITKFYSDCVGRSNSETGCDELMDAVVILLCNIETSKLLTLYCQLKLLADIMPDWLQRGPHCFTLMQFIGACQFIQDRLTFKRHRLEMSSHQTDV